MLKKDKIILIFILFLLTLFTSNFICASSFKIKRKSINVYDTFDLKTIINESSNVKAYSSTNENIVSVTQNGIITGNSMGQANITAVDTSGNTTTCIISVGYYVGIDISTFNNNVNWANIKNEGIDFVMIRSSYGWYDSYDAAAGKEYGFQYDAQLYNNIKGASEYGIPFGIYHYSYAQNTTQAALEAEYTINALKSTGNYANNISLPVAYDIEDSKWQGHLDKNTLTDIVITYCTKIREAGYSPMIYASKTWFLEHLDIYRLNNLGYDFWYALWHHSPGTEQVQIGDTGIYPLIWQHTSQGSIEGANTNAGTVDMNVMYMKERVKIEFINDETTYTTKIIDKGSKITNFPTVEKEGYYFKGWKDSQGNIVTTSTTFSSNTILTAVYEKIIPLESISLSNSSNYLLKNNSIDLSINYLPENTNVDKTITWSSSNKEIATIDKNGKVTGISRGTATITATSNYNNKITATYKVIVYEDIKGDADNSGNIDISDAYTLLKRIVNSIDTLNSSTLPNGDYNLDNVIDISDVYIIIKYLSSKL